MNAIKVDPMMNRQEAEEKLRYLFKLPAFYDEQWTTIERLLYGERVLLIEKTGYGKSLCFQFPATQFEGTTVIFSPLIALMRDQVKKLSSLGITATCINSEQTAEENSRILSEAIEGKFKILYIAPERQENNEWIEATIQMNLKMVVIDEAHCISVWGHDFRPAFRRIINLVNLLPKGIPVLATTATATKRVEEDIARQIGGNILTVRGNLMRENFKLFVINVSSDDEKLIWLGQNIEKVPGSGIIYTGTRVDTEIYSKWFEYLNIPCTAYNAGLDAESRIAIEAGLMNDTWKCIFSTNALGMGIDKPDIRFIIHTQIPQSPVHYYQEIGRAGRDGKPASIILFYNKNDKSLPLAFIEGGRPPLSKYEKVIKVIKSELLGEKELMKRTNLKQTQIRVIKADLLDQGIAREVMNGKSKKLEFIPGSAPLNAQTFEQLRKEKLKDLDMMIQYVDTNESRMKFLCDYLGDSTEHVFKNCDNTGEKKLVVTGCREWEKKIKRFRDSYFPVLDLESKGSKMVNGIAGSYYGFSDVGTSIHRCKYEGGGEFPDPLLRLVLRAIRKKFRREKFDLLLYVPPSSSGNLVQNFATKIAEVLKIPIFHELQKTRQTKEQKVLENGYLKTDNVKDAFTYLNPSRIHGKKILLIDDISDSGATFKEIGQILTKFGAIKIAPVAIAKTVAGDLS